MTGQMLIFVVLATVIIVSAAMVVLKNNPVASAFSLVVTFFAASGIYALMGAHFLAALQVLVYAGAIMVLFVFVIMLLNADEPVSDLSQTPFWIKLTAFLSVLVLGRVLYFLLSTVRSLNVVEPSLEISNSINISTALFSDHIFAFELTSFLLLGVIVSTITLAKRKRSKSVQGYSEVKE